jgi:hypothetical protein
MASAMNEQEFRTFLKRGGRSDSAQERVLRMVREFSDFLQAKYCGKALGQAGAAELESFIRGIETETGKPAKTHLWAIRYYFEFIENEPLQQFAARMRGERIKRKAFKLRDFMGVDGSCVKKLQEAGISDVQQMLARGKNPQEREQVAASTGIPVGIIEEFVKLSDLARIPGIKTKRARLYFEAGVDTLEKMAGWEPKALRQMLIEYVARTGFDGIAPLLGEAQYSVKKAKELPKIVVFE